MKRLLITVLLLLAGQMCAAKTVRLITIGPGDAFWSAFGHTAIAIDEDVYGFGYFSFDLETVQSFVSNSMMYELGISEINHEAYLAQQQNREFSVIELHLSEEQIKALEDHLTWHALPANMTYPYDYFLNNCSTKIRDLLILAWPARFQQNSQNTTSSYFTHTFPAKHQGLMNLGIALAYGWEAYVNRSQWELMAFPVYLEQHVMQVMSEQIGPRHVVYQAEPSDAIAYFFKTHWALLAYLMLWTLMLLPKSNLLAAKSWFMWHGLVGVVLLAMWLLTPHEVVSWNANVLLFSPLGLLIVFSRHIKHFIYPGWVLWLLLSLYMNAWYLLPLLIPATLAMRNWHHAQSSTQ